MTQQQSPINNILFVSFPAVSRNISIVSHRLDSLLVSPSSPPRSSLSYLVDFFDIVLVTRAEGVHRFPLYQIESTDHLLLLPLVEERSSFTSDRRSTTNMITLSAGHCVSFAQDSFEPR